MSLDKLVGHALDGAKKIIVEKGEEAQPAFLFQRADGSIDVVLIPWQEHEKQIAFDMVRTILREALVITAYCFATEAWYTNAENGTWDGVMPSKSPRRRECLLIDAWERTGAHIYRMIEIVTTPGGRWLGKDMDIPHDTEMAGRAMNFFAPEKPSVLDNPKGGA